MWFKPPFRKCVSTNVAKTFLQLITKYFPRSHKFHKIFNHNTVKVSQSCTNNMSKIMKGHNRKVTSRPHDKRPNAIAEKQQNVQWKGNREVNNVVYKRDVTRTLSKKVYLGLAEREWKSRFSNHKLSFEHKRYSNNTTHSNYTWHLKNASHETPN